MKPSPYSITNTTKNLNVSLIFYLPLILGVLFLTSELIRIQLDSHWLGIVYSLHTLMTPLALLEITRERRIHEFSLSVENYWNAKSAIMLTLLLNSWAIYHFNQFEKLPISSYPGLLQLSCIANYFFQTRFFGTRKIINPICSKSAFLIFLLTLFVFVAFLPILPSELRSQNLPNLLGTNTIIIATAAAMSTLRRTLTLNERSKNHGITNSQLPNLNLLSMGMLDNLSAKVCMIDSSGKIISFNKAWIEFFQNRDLHDSMVIVGKNLIEICEFEHTKNKEAMSKISHGIRAVMDNSSKEYIAQVNFSIHDVITWFYFRVGYFESESGKYFIIILEDISELKKREEELLLKSFAIERANDGIVLTDPTLPDNPVVYVSQGFLKLTGYLEHEVIGRNCRFMQGPDSDPQVIQKIREAIASEASFDGEIINYTKDGRPWYNRLKLEPIRNSEGKLIRYVGVQLNVTEEKKLDFERRRALQKEKAARQDVERLYKEAQNANSIKDEFLATLSHELRTPAGVIVGFTELLKYEDLGSQEKEEALEALERNARALVTLIDDMLDMSRAITGKFKLNPKPVDLTSVVESVIAAEVLAAQTKNIRIVTEFEPGAGPIFGDTTRLQQIFWNLLSNAIKFTPRNGRVKVSIHTEGNRLIVRVTDTGVGIESKFLPHVFERFRQQESGLNRNFGGLGLGLSIVKHLVELHGGSVKADSAGIGRGSTFTVNLPAITAAG